MKDSRILKYIEFIKEEMNDTPETYIDNKLKMIQKSINDLFEEGDEVEKDDIEKISVRQAKEQKNKNLNFKDLNVHLDSSEISKYSQTDDSLTVKFSDADSTYNLYISINIKDGLNSSSEDDVKNCFVKFKKYNLESMELYGQITKNVEINNDETGKMTVVKIEGKGEEAKPEGESMSIEDFLLDLKIEIDKKFGDEQEEFEIETE